MAESWTVSSSRPTLHFLGATGTVTGSRFLLQTADARVLIDCGLFQGMKADRERNWRPFPVPPESIDAVILTHAHIDHSGYLPGLVRHGFTGPIHASTDTAELCEILLTDAAHLQEEEARYANRKGYSRHSPALPLYTSEDAEAAISQFERHAFGARFAVATGIEAELRWAGHILGSASVLAHVDDGERTRRLFVSGDLGRPDHPLLVAPEPPPAADVILVESTYGDRNHAPTEHDIEQLAAVVSDTASRGGMVLIPAFAVDRTEVVLDALHQLEADGRIPRLPIFVDSPMALDVLGVYRAALDDGHRGLRDGLEDRSPFDTERVTECRSVEASKGLAALTYPSIIISASGMATGGRVLHHLRRLLPDPANSVVFSGFQVDGTRGSRLVDGERTIKMFGGYVPVRAGVHQLESFSVHADRDELLSWLRAAPEPPETCFVVHGSPHAARALRDRIDDELGWTAAVPNPLERVVL